MAVLVCSLTCKEYNGIKNALQIVLDAHRLFTSTAHDATGFDSVAALRKCVRRDTIAHTLARRFFEIYIHTSTVGHNICASVYMR